MSNKLSLKSIRLWIIATVLLCFVSIAVFGGLNKRLNASAYTTDVDLADWSEIKMWDFDDPFYQQLGNDGRFDNGYITNTPTNTVHPNIWWDCPPHIVLANVPDGEGGSVEKSVIKMSQTITDRFFSNFYTPIKGGFKNAFYEFSIDFKVSGPKEHFAVNLGGWNAHNIFAHEAQWTELGDGWYNYTVVMNNGTNVDANLFFIYDTWGGDPSHYVMISNISLKERTAESPATFGENLINPIPELNKQRINYWIDALTNKGYAYDGIHSWADDNFAEIVKDPSDDTNQVLRFSNTNGKNFSNLDMRFGHADNTNYKISFKAKLSDPDYMGAFAGGFVGPHPAAPENNFSFIASKNNWVDLGDDWYLVEAEVNSGVGFWGMAFHFETIIGGVDKSVLIDDFKIESSPFNKRPLLDRINAIETQMDSLNAEDYRPLSWTTLTTKLQDAKNVIENSEATQANINVALSDLNNAYTNLSLKGVSYALEMRIAELAELYESENEANYTTASWTAFTDAYEEAEDVLDNGESTADDFTQALTDLNTAHSGLTAKGNTADLLEYIADNELAALFAAGNNGKYSTTSWTAFSTAFTTANTIGSDVSQAELDSALEALETAFENLSADKSKLVEYIENEDLEAVVDAGNTDYTTSSWSAFKTAYDTAAALIDNASALQSAVDQALIDLKAEYLNLAYLGDKTALEAFISENDLSELSSSGFSAGWADFKAAYDVAVAVVASLDVEQSEVDEALSDLEEAFESLVAVTDPGTNPGTDEPKPGCRGTISSSALIASVIAAIGAVVLLKKKRTNN